jgi:DNA invertase Pin-like site-specific DNA recombinase
VASNRARNVIVRVCRLFVGFGDGHRPALAEALVRARKERAPIIVAKLDRLSRDVHYISGLMKHRVPFIVTGTRFCSIFTPPRPRRSVG